jgi:phage antirepressor YoqD-like protein
MNKKLKTYEAPEGYISISDAAKILEIDPFELRVWMHRKTSYIHTRSTPDRRLWVFEKSILKAKKRKLLDRSE